MFEVKRRRPLPLYKRLYNNKHEWVRNRVENIVAFVKRHKVFKQTWTHSYDLLHIVLTVTGHVSALQLRRFQHFQGYGPWRHY